MIERYPMAVYLRVLASLALGGFFVASAGFKLVATVLFAEQSGAEKRSPSLRASLVWSAQITQSRGASYCVGSSL